MVRPDKKLSDLILGVSKSWDNITDKTLENISAYKDNYLFNHLEALERKFPSLNAALGKDNFKYFGYRYLRHSPPSNYDIDHFGGDFGEFIGEQPELSAQTVLPLLGKLDLLWFVGREGDSMKAPKGLLGLWNSLVHETEDLASLDFESEVTITVLFKSGDMYFSET